MTIDEAIEKYKTMSTKGHIMFPQRPDIAEKSNLQYKQTYEWLEELKALREKDQKLIHLTQKEFDVGTQYTYNKAIDDFVRRCKCMNIDNYNYPSDCINLVAKQLKDGGTNGS